MATAVFDFHVFGQFLGICENSSWRGPNVVFSSEKACSCVLNFRRSEAINQAGFTQNSRVFKGNSCVLKGKPRVFKGKWRVTTRFQGEIIVFQEQPTRFQGETRGGEARPGRSVVFGFQNLQVFGSTKSIVLGSQNLQVFGSTRNLLFLGPETGSTKTVCFGKKHWFFQRLEHAVGLRKPFFSQKFWLGNQFFLKKFRKNWFLKPFSEFQFLKPNQYNYCAPTVP